VTEALAVGVPDEVKGESIVVFAVVRPAPAGGDANHLPADIGQAVTSVLGKSFAPGAVHLVPALPKTRNGKILRRVARAAYLGLDPGDVSALEDPGTLEPIRALRG
jgi:acetyl-CoA synthetase